MDKARSWFNRAVTLNPDIGDFWAQYFRFEGQHGSPEQQAEVVKRWVMGALGLRWYLRDGNWARGCGSAGELCIEVQAGCAVGSKFG